MYLCPCTKNEHITDMVISTVSSYRVGGIISIRGPFIGIIVFLLLWVSEYSFSGTLLEVREIRFNGNLSFSASKLKEFMDTKEKTILHPFRNVPFDEEVFKEDLERLKQFYQSEGFYDVTIVDFKVEKVGDRALRIVINISEGLPTRLSNIMLTINGDGIDLGIKKSLEALLPLKEGDIFRTESYRNSEKIILRYLAEEGYPKAKVDTLARIFKEERKAFVWIDVDIGPRCTFGRLQIEGIQYVDPREIFRLVSFKEGEIFRASKIKESQKRLWDSQLFSFVDITVKGLDGEDTKLPIVITLREAKPYTIKAGIGYGTEDGLRSKVGFEARRFLGDARRLSVQARASNLVQQLESRFIQPHFLLDPWWMEFRGGIGRTNETSYEAETFFSTPQVNIPIISTLRGFIGPNIETNKITKLDIYPYDPDIPDRQRDNYFISSLIFGFAEERVDTLVDPTKGFRIFTTTEWASEILGSDISYIRADLEVRTYYPFQPGWVLANRLHWGIISNPETGSNIPIFKRFFAGGSNSNRGYSYHKLGPLDDLGNALGGKGIFELNTDLRFPLEFVTRDLEGVLFFDASQVFSGEELMLNKLRYSVGAGLRYKTIVGPIRADLGYAINPPDKNPPDSFQFFISVGQAF
ncbi:MAG: outer membrane protein assembly factor BamA [Syntrophobacterales bacterium]|nr:outer membrane protein assembly factor BamA [Syntrophobacterales bacterium]